jgi:hypothetical protein
MGGNGNYEESKGKFPADSCDFLGHFCDFLVFPAISLVIPALALLFLRFPGIVRKQKKNTGNDDFCPIRTAIQSVTQRFATQAK